MKTTNQLALGLLIAALFAVSPYAMGQKADEHLSQQNYRIKLVRNDNGKKEVLDKRFKSGEEIQAYLNEQGIVLEEFLEATKLLAKPTEPDNLKSGTGETKERLHVMVIEKEAGKGDKNKKSQRLTNSLSSTNSTFVSEKNVSASSKSTPTWEIVEKDMLPDPSGGGQKEPPLSNADPSSATSLSELSLYPNPSGGNFHVSFRTAQPADVILRMNDLNGKQVYFNIIRNQLGFFEKDIFFAGGLPKGSYLLEAIAGEQRVTTRVVVQ